MRFTGPSASSYEYGIVRSTTMCDLLEDRSHAWGGSDKCYSFGCWVWPVLPARGLLCRSAENFLKLGKVEWLREEVNNAKFPRGNSVFDFAVSGDDNGWGSLCRGKRLKKCEAILIWQADVQNHCVVVPFRLERFPGLGCGGSGFSLKPGLFHGGGQSKGEGMFVFDDKDGG